MYKGNGGINKRGIGNNGKGRQELTARGTTNIKAG